MLMLVALSGLGINPGAHAESSTAEVSEARHDLMVAVYAWLKATIEGDFAAQAAFYPERMEAFYLWRDVPKPDVMKEKRRVFEQVRTIDIEMEPPQVIIDQNTRFARLYFRKTYAIEGKVSRKGVVLQELRWAREKDGWKIVSERDLRVIRQARR
jgi:hypothetical protein